MGVGEAGGSLQTPRSPSGPSGAWAEMAGAMSQVALTVSVRPLAALRATGLRDRLSDEAVRFLDHLIDEVPGWSDEQRQRIWQEPLDGPGVVVGVLTLRTPGVPCVGLASLTTPAHRLWREIFPDTNDSHLVFFDIVDAAIFKDALELVSRSRRVCAADHRTRQWLDISEGCRGMVLEAVARFPQGGEGTVGAWVAGLHAEMLQLDFPVLTPLVNLLLEGNLQVFACEARGVCRAPEAGASQHPQTPCRLPSSVIGRAAAARAAARRTMPQAAAEAGAAVPPGERSLSERRLWGQFRLLHESSG